MLFIWKTAVAGRHAAISFVGFLSWTEELDKLGKFDLMMALDGGLGPHLLLPNISQSSSG